jgi:alkylation response protein AidB-like acyl-CoA dehydrogenase
MLEIQARQHQLVGDARRLAGVWEAEAEASEAAACLSQASVDALFDAGLFHVLVPECLGGAEADIRTAFEVIEEVSRIDGSTGWTLLAAGTTLGIAGAFFGDDAVASIFADPRALTAGQVAPLGIAVSEGDGYRVEGRFGFGSASHHANWMFGGFREQRDGQPVRLANGMPNVIAAVVPRTTVEFVGTWDVIGLQATGSLDYQIPAQHVTEGFTFPLFTAVPKRGGPLYRLGVNGLTCIAHAGFALGVAARALDEIATLSLTKRRIGRALLVDDPIFQHEYAKAVAELRGARAFVIDAFDAIEQAAEAGEVTLRLRAECRLATTTACNAAASITDMAYRHSGSVGLRRGSVIHRCFRDVAAGEQHVFTDQQTYRDTARVLLDQARPDTFL